MKIEMGESLFYSWLRHEEELERLMKLVDGHFHTQYRYSIFKQNSSLVQIISRESATFGGSKAIRNRGAAEL